MNSSIGPEFANISNQVGYITNLTTAVGNIVMVIKMVNGKWCIYIAPLTKALYIDFAVHSPIHTPMVAETMQGTNLLTRSN